MEMFERLAYYGVRMVIPIYIAQADEPMGLHFTQIEKGYIFLWWALVQTLVPMFSGGFADRYGFKKTIAVSVAIKIVGYLLMATQREYYPFLLGCLFLALGTGTFKPGVQGTMCQTMDRNNSSVGWGAFYMLVNIGAFLGPPLAHYLYGISWPAVFYGCAAIVSLNFLMLFSYKDPKAGGDQSGGPLHILKMTIKNFMNPRLTVFILIMSGFWLILMQLLDMMPNFIVDWVDSSQMVKDFNLPSWMLQYNTIRGTQIAQEWLLNANGGLIIISVLFISWIVARMRRVISMSLGTLVASLGLLLAGSTTSGYVCLAGILVFSVGEMLASPKMNEYLGVIAPEGQKGLYMGYASIPWAIGWCVGSIWAGNVYDKLGDKANLALRYLSDNFQIFGIERTEAMSKLMEVTGMNAVDATNMLWEIYDPYKLWYQFAAVGIASSIAMIFYARWVRQHESADA